MKTIPAILASIALTASASAVEYVTLAVDSRGGAASPPSAQTLAVDPTSVVELVGERKSGVFPSIAITFADGTVSEGISLNNQVTGVSSILIDAGSGTQTRIGHYTFKITPAAEINPVGPTTVLVLPENSTGNYDVVLDSSTDLVTWTPFFSQTVTAPAAANFYRARIVKTPAP